VQQILVSEAVVNNIFLLKLTLICNALWLLLSHLILLLVLHMEIFFSKLIDYES